MGGKAGAPLTAAGLFGAFSAAGFTSGLLAVGFGLPSAGLAAAGAGADAGAEVRAGAVAGAGGWASSSFIFCRKASRALAMLSESADGWATGAGDGWAAGSAARSGRRAAQDTVLNCAPLKSP